MSEDQNLVPARPIGNIYCGTCSWTDRTLIESGGEPNSPASHVHQAGLLDEPNKRPYTRVDRTPRRSACTAL
jgi:hypothetical protein